jgi:glycosyltransferase involved in cell wall biosynthesis
VAPGYRPILDVLRDGESALLFEPQSQDGLASALQRLADDRNFAGALGRRGRELIESRHNWRANAVTVLDALSARRLHG